MTLNKNALLISASVFFSTISLICSQAVYYHNIILDKIVKLIRYEFKAYKKFNFNLEKKEKK